MDRRRTYRRLILLPVVIAAAGLTACGDDGSGTAQVGGAANGRAGTNTQLQAREFGFKPAAFTVASGAPVTVTLANGDAVEHNFTFTEAKADVDVASGETGDVTFVAPDESGTYTYYCKYHRDRGMTGTVTVSDRATADSPGSSTQTSTEDGSVRGGDDSSVSPTAGQGDVSGGGTPTTVQNPK